jgi:TRAP-type C4-dicarboxylate transport system substrate-binding protein
MENEMWELAGEMDRKSVKTLAENGMKVLKVDSAFRAQLNKVGKELRAKWAEKAGKDAQQIMEEYYRITGR